MSNLALPQVRRLANADGPRGFEASIRQLRAGERRLENTRLMRGCLTTACGSTTKFNYYSTKLDATAWADCGANPRGKTTPPSGSR